MSYTLHYFDAKGRAEVLRLVFAAAGKPYTDKRVKMEEWGKLKGASPQGFLPYLDVGGKVKIPQNQAILRYLAREFGMYGKNNIDYAKVDAYIETVFEIYQKGIMKVFCKDEAKKKELTEEFDKKHVPLYLGILEKDGCGEGGFLVGKTMTVADVYVFSLIEYFKLEDILKTYPKLKASYDKVAANKGVKEYIKKRPETPF